MVPDYSFKHWITLKNHSIQFSIQKQNQIIHSKNLFIQKNSKLFIQMKYSFKWKLEYHPGLRTTIAQKQHFFTQKHCFRANFFTIYSFLLWISHIFIHSIIHSIVCWKIFIQRIYSFNKKSKIFIQRIYSFKTIPNYSFKENIHSSEKWIIAQGYLQLWSGEIHMVFLW